MAYNINEINGDIALGHDLIMGGDLDVKGGGVVARNLHVRGWLVAPNVTGANKGLFASEAELLAAFPSPAAGGYALVGSTLPAALYIAKDGAWVKTSDEVSGSLDKALSDYVGSLVKGEADVRAAADSALDERIATVESAVSAADEQLAALAQQITTVSENATAADNNLDVAIKAAAALATSAQQTAATAQSTASEAKGNASSALSKAGANAAAIEALEALTRDGMDQVSITIDGAPYGEAGEVTLTAANLLEAVRTLLVKEYDLRAGVVGHTALLGEFQTRVAAAEGRISALEAGGGASGGSIIIQ